MDSRTVRGCCPLDCQDSCAWVAHVEGGRVVRVEGANLLTTSPHHWRFVKAARERHGAQVVCIDPRRTRTAQACDEHLPIRPGSDAVLAAGLAHVALREGIADLEHAGAATCDLDAFRDQMVPWTPERVASVCEVAPSALPEGLDLPAPKDAGWIKRPPARPVPGSAAKLHLCGGVPLPPGPPHPDMHRGVVALPGKWRNGDATISGSAVNDITVPTWSSAGQPAYDETFVEILPIRRSTGAAGADAPWKVTGTL